jgi:hypothetical protein
LSSGRAAAILLLIETTKKGVTKMETINDALRALVGGKFRAATDDEKIDLGVSPIDIISIYYEGDRRALAYEIDYGEAYALEIIDKNYSVITRKKL